MTASLGRSSRFYIFALLAALLVSLSCLGFGFFLDDYYLLLGLMGNQSTNTTFDLYRFADGNIETTLQVMNMGPLPWYTLPELKLHFWRPLTCATMALDHLLFNRNGMLFHAHSILWYVAFVAIAGLIFRRALPGGLGAFALILFAVDEAHWFPVAWWANRNALVAAAPALLGFFAHMRWREANWKPGLPLSILGYAIGLLGGETALGVFGYLFAYEWMGAAGAPKRSLLNRICALMPAAIVGAAYIVAYKIGNYGAYGSGIYLDPSRDLLGYLVRLPACLLQLAAAHFFALPVEMSASTPAAYVPFIAISVVLTGIIILAMRRIWPFLATGERASLRWLFWGAFFSALPVCATFASGRLLLLPSFGGAAAIAVLIRAGYRKIDMPVTWPRILAWTLIAIHLIIAPLIWPGMTLMIRCINQKALGVINSMDIHPTQTADQEVFLLNAGNPILGYYPLMMRTHQGLPVPRHMHALCMAPFDTRLTRTAPNAFEMEIIDGEMLTRLFEQLLRDKHFPLKTGDTVALDGIRIDVLETGKSGPKRFLCTFDTALEDPRYAFLSLDSGGMRRITLPPIGESIVLPHPNTLMFKTSWRKQAEG